MRTKKKINKNYSSFIAVCVIYIYLLLFYTLYNRFFFHFDSIYIYYINLIYKLLYVFVLKKIIIQSLCIILANLRRCLFFI